MKEFELKYGCNPKIRNMIEAYKKDQSTPLNSIALGGQFAYFVKKK